MYLSQRLTRSQEALIVLKEVAIDFFRHESTSVFQSVDLFVNGVWISLRECLLERGVDVEGRIVVSAHERELCLDAIQDILGPEFLLLVLRGHILDTRLPRMTGCFSLIGCRCIITW